MSQRIAPSEQKAPELRAMLDGQSAAQSGGAWLSLFVRLSTERVVQEALAQEQAETLGRARYERRAESQGYRHGYEDGTLKTAEGVLRLKVPQLSGRAAPARSQLWRGVANTSELLKTLWRCMRAACPSATLKRA